MNTPVSLKVAKLLKEKGFNEKCSQLYFDGELKEITVQKVSYDDTLSSRYFICPTIADVVMWLYDKHGIWIKNDIISINQVIKFYSSYYKISNGLTDLPVQLEGNFNSPTEAYEAAIKHVFENIK